MCITCEKCSEITNYAFVYIFYMHFSNISNKSKEMELIGVVFNQDCISRPMGAYPTPTTNPFYVLHKMQLLN